MSEAISWGEWQYENIPPNEQPSPDDLELVLCEVRKNPTEIRRRAHIALELAQHPALNDSERQSYLSEANDLYDLIMYASTPPNVLELSDNLTYTFLPLLGNYTKTSAKAANREVKQHSQHYVRKIVNHHQHSTEVARGAAAELVAATALRQQWYRVFPSLYRQDNPTTLVDGQRYAWDVSAACEPLVDTEPEDVLKLQVKHRDFNSRKNAYHPDITIHRVFPPSEPYNDKAPQKFRLLHAALGIHEDSDPAAYKKYTARLVKDLN